MISPPSGNNDLDMHGLLINTLVSYSKHQVLIAQVLNDIFTKPDIRGALRFNFPGVIL